MTRLTFKDRNRCLVTFCPDEEREIPFREYFLPEEDGRDDEGDLTGGHLVQEIEKYPFLKSLPI